MKKFFENGAYLLFGAVIAFLILQVLSFVLDTSFPVVSVVSGSMRHDTGNFDMWVTENNKSDEIRGWKFTHGFKEGDMIIVVGAKKESLRVGDVVVYRAPSVPYPIIHRIIDVTENETYITKGDNNLRVDPFEVKLEWIEGKAVFAVPTLGIPRYAIITLLQF